MTARALEPLLTVDFRWARIVLFLAPLMLCAAATAGEPSRFCFRDDNVPYPAPPAGEPGRYLPMEPPPADDGGVQFPEYRRHDGSGREEGGREDVSPDDGVHPRHHRRDFRREDGDGDREDRSDSPRRFRSRDFDGDAPRHERSHIRHDPRSKYDSEDALPEPERIQHKLSARYGNPAVMQLVRSLSPQRSVDLYQEVSALIDARHLKPSSYDARVKQAARNLLGATENRMFLRANGLSDDPAQLDAFRNDLRQLAEGRRIEGAEDAFQALQWTIRAAEKDAQLPPQGVAVEFVFGACDSLDKYSGFVPALNRASPSVELEDHIVGIGVEIKTEDQAVVISNALPGSPAAEAGLRSGDIIETVDGHRLEGNTVEFAADYITGQAGTKVTLGIRRDDGVQEVALVRRRVEMHSVSAEKMIDDKVGYIKLDKFAQNSAEEVDKALWDLYRQGMKSLVFDVRGNPGGLLTTAIELSDKFVPSGTIVSTRGRDRADNMVEYARRDHTWKIPLVVLVDENSASASEIFAAAVQENGRGVVVGRRTYGKGCVQTHFPLQTITGNLRLTTAEFFAPTGRTMAGAGVEPDIHVEAGEHHRHMADDREAPYDHEGSHWREGSHHREAAYRHETGYRSVGSRGPDRELEVAVQAATSEEAINRAQSAGNRQNREGRMFPDGG